MFLNTRTLLLPLYSLLLPIQRSGRTFTSVMGQAMTIIPKEDALPGRADKMVVSSTHAVHNRATVEPFPEHLENAMFGMGCFWGAEKRFWNVPGVFSTQVGYSGGHTENPTYNEICSGKTNHAEVVRMQFNPSEVKYVDLLKIFWESHNPTQGMRQGNDIGTTYRSAIYCYGEQQLKEAQETKEKYEVALKKKGFPAITTEICPAMKFYYAEDYHQQYLHKNPSGYCGLGGTGVSCPREEL
ncbi:peptide methionine sulfoxide reductase MsrA isoform X1 [Octopus bimaculoides]|uniref:Mitochondrial peptide methionine sulfoxide reductase n=3 Tax=Octopus bimaculoides TaxID=37653 RepID=A0A0L8FNW5_OCTBM|nr:peptide methionine sulfoxide reductase MsrA isoform X1 [Octopus bimaculoides]|eukprot:XP_014788218.1 PREDICTED: peptide methionine sulfoxide reductase MsrA-like isoform X1 [Octopus bimaculoides]